MSERLSGEISQTRRIMAAAALGCFVIAGIQESPPAIAPAVDIQMRFSEESQAGCDFVNSTQLAKVDEAFASPPLPLSESMLQVSSLFKIEKNYGIDLDADSKRKTLQAQLYLGAAERTGLTVYDPLPTLKKLDATLANESFTGPVKFEEYLKIVNDYTSQYGVEVGPARKGDGQGHNFNFYHPKAGDFDNDNSKRSMNGIVEGLSALPLEYLKAAGLKRVKLYFSTAPGVGGFAVGNEGAIALPIGPGLLSSPANFRHEVAHLLDKAICESQVNHQQLIDIAKGGLREKELIALNDGLLTLIDLALAARDGEYVCSLNDAATTVAQKRMTLTAYGNSMTEIYAEILANVGSQPFANAIRPEAPPRVRDRIRIIMGHVASVSDQLLEYFALITPPARPVNNPRDRISAACQAGAISQYYR